MSGTTSQTAQTAKAEAPESRTQFVVSGLMWVAPLVGFWFGALCGFGLTGKAISSQVPDALMYGLILLTFFSAGEIKMVRLIGRGAFVSIGLQIATIILLARNVPFFGRHQYAAVLAAIVAAKALSKLLGRVAWKEQFQQERDAMAQRLAAKKAAKPQQGFLASVASSVAAPEPNPGVEESEAAADLEPSPVVSTAPRPRPSGLAE